MPILSYLKLKQTRQYKQDNKSTVVVVAVTIRLWTGTLTPSGYCSETSNATLCATVRTLYMCTYYMADLLLGKVTYFTIRNI